MIKEQENLEELTMNLFPDPPTEGGGEGGEGEDKD